MEFDQLRTFLAVLEHRSFGRAGEALGIGQSTVSFHVKALEQKVGVVLLERGRGRIAPTAAGRALLPYAERIVALVDEAGARLATRVSGEVGELSLAASTIPGEYLLPPLLAEFRAQHPGIRLEMAVFDSDKALAALASGEVDMAIVGKKPKGRELESEVFASDEIVLVGLAGNSFAPSGKLTLKELRDVPLVLREQGSGTRDAIARLLPHVHDSKNALRVGSTEAAKRCVQHGLGLSFLSRQSVASELAAGHFSIVELSGTPARRTFYAVRRRSVTPSAALLAFRALFAQRRR